MKKLKYRHLVMIVSLGLFGLACGSVSIDTEETGDLAGTDEISGEAIYQNLILTQVTDFESALLSAWPVGDQASAKDIITNVLQPLPHVDNALRVFGKTLYSINRLGRDSVHSIDPLNNFATINEFSTGRASNPHDFLRLADDKAYVTLYQADQVNGMGDVLVVNPENIDPSTGQWTVRKRIDLSSLIQQDNQLYARAHKMALINGMVWVLLQDLDGAFGGFQALNEGTIAIIDPSDDSIVDINPAREGLQGIRLSGRNPEDLVYNSNTDLVYITMSGFFQTIDGLITTDPSDSYGGIEVVDPNTFISSGIVIDDLNLGGYVRDIVMSSANAAFVIIESKRIAIFDPINFTVLKDNLYETPGTFLSDIHLLDEDTLIIADRGDERGHNAGLILLKTQEPWPRQGPYNVGGPPGTLAVMGLGD